VKYHKIYCKLRSLQKVTQNSRSKEFARNIRWIKYQKTMKHLLILLSLLLLSSPVIGQETGVLFFREVNDKWGWFEDGNKDKDVKYIGEFKDGTFEDRQPNGQGTITYPNGRKYVGEWKNKEKWNGIGYDKNGDFVVRFVNGEQQ